MAKPQNKFKTSKPKPIEVELEPDAWPRFERFIKQAAKAGPQHRAAKKPSKSKGKKAKG
jgi:hypothetical protein